MGESTTSEPAALQLSPNAARYAATTADERLVAIEQLAALVASTHAELLDVITAADACGDWELDGATATPPWLVGRLGLGRENANEWARVGAALQALPELRHAYATGAMSWDQVRPATKFATPDDDAALADELPGRSARQIAYMARQRRPLTDFEANDAHAARSFRWRRDHRRGGWVYGGFLPFDQGDAVNHALDQIAEQWGPDADTGRWAPIATRRADAVHDLATRLLGSSSAPDRATVVIHADRAVIDGEQPGNGFIGDLAVCHSGVMRSLCDARVEVALHGPDGSTVGVARASQQVPWWLRRQVQARDHHCRGFGCERTIRQVHHIVHWGCEGETNLDNLIGLCWEHHRLVHEGGWNIVGNANGEVVFVSPDGDRRLVSRPQPLHPSVTVSAGEPSSASATRLDSAQAKPGTTRQRRARRRGPPGARSGS
jgi:hypothetical protein